LTALNNQVQKVKLAIEGVNARPDDWVYWTEETERDGSAASLKPLVAAPYMDLVRSGGMYRVYMSAYPGEKHIFCRSLGLDPREVAWIKLKSPFAPESRPIIMGCVGSMSKKNKPQTLPVMLKTIAKVLAAHHNEKGVIHCLDEKTKVMTFEGFKGIEMLKKGDLIATLNPKSQEMEYQPALQVVRRRHQGPMISVQTRGLDMLVTPEHRIYAYIGKNGKNTSVFEAHNLVGGMRVFGRKKAHIFKIPQTARWNSGSPLCRNYARFLGWFCAEGSAFITTWKGKKNYKVCIDQNSIEQTEIPELIVSLGYHAWIRHSACDTAVITSKKLCLDLRNACYTGDPSCFTKRVPDIIKNSDVSAIKQFLLALVAGDGTTRHNTATRSECAHMQLYTVSRHLCLDVVELALKCGWHASFATVDRSVFKPSRLNGRDVKGDKYYVVYLGSGNKTSWITPGDASAIDYDGEVFCPTTENGIIFVERNGKTYWTGNCNSYALGTEIYDHFRVTPQGLRLLFPKCADDRDGAMNKHRMSPEPTVLISPSMTEGFDFKDDLARWQIIAKMPYPYLGDRQVAAMKDRNPDWYSMQTATTVIQACGRIVRDEKDHGVTYMLDGDFRNLFERYGYMFPKWFQSAMVWP
jgi:hypothetical protein